MFQARPKTTTTTPAFPRPDCFAAGKNEDTIDAHLNPWRGSSFDSLLLENMLLKRPLPLESPLLQQNILSAVLSAATALSQQEKPRKRPREPPMALRKAVLSWTKNPPKCVFFKKKRERGLFYQQQRFHVPVDPPGRVEHGHDRNVVLALIVSPGTGLVPDGNPFYKKSFLKN